MVGHKRVRAHATLLAETLDHVNAANFRQNVRTIRISRNRSSNEATREKKKGRKNNGPTQKNGGTMNRVIQRGRRENKGWKLRMNGEVRGNRHGTAHFFPLLPPSHSLRPSKKKKKRKIVWKKLFLLNRRNVRSKVY